MSVGSQLLLELLLKRTKELRLCKQDISIELRSKFDPQILLDVPRHRDVESCTAVSLKRDELSRIRRADESIVDVSPHVGPMTTFQLDEKARVGHSSLVSSCF
jgi:hypothetical protein